MCLCTAAESDGVPISVQETTSSKISPMISGKTVLVPDMDDADADISDHGETFDVESLLVQLVVMHVPHSVLGGWFFWAY